jgi:hypothetical protein
MNTPVPVKRKGQGFCAQLLSSGSREKKGWLGRQDSNLGMAVPKTAALPLGDAPPLEPTRTVIHTRCKGRQHTHPIAWPQPLGLAVLRGL